MEFSIFQLKNYFLLLLILLNLCKKDLSNGYINSQLIELNDKFLQVKNEGLWFVEVFS